MGTGRKSTLFSPDVEICGGEQWRETGVELRLADEFNPGSGGVSVPVLPPEPSTPENALADGSDDIVEFVMLGAF